MNIDGCERCGKKPVVAVLLVNSPICQPCLNAYIWGTPNVVERAGKIVEKALNEDPHHRDP